MKHNLSYFNKEAFLEGICCFLFAGALFYFAVTDKYLLFVTPRMKKYLYFSVLVMVIWGVSSFRRLFVPQYQMQLNRLFVLVVPMIAMLLPYTVLNASDSSITDMVASIQNASSDSTGIAEKNSGAENNVNSPTPQNTSATDAIDQNADSQQQPTATQTDTSSSMQTTSENEDIPSGLDTASKTITISDTEFYQWLVQLSYYPEKYEGYTLHIHGTVYREEDMDANEFAVTRLLMSCCVADLANCGPLCIWEDAGTLTQDAWINVTGTYHYDHNKGMEINVTDVEAAEPSEEQYIYPY